MRLNAENCVFGVGVGKFLGYLITNWGIEINPDQIDVVRPLNPPSNPKEVQKSTGMLAALNRFISKFVDRCRPFYQLLKKWRGFQWDEECDITFRDLKDYLMQAPVLTAPELGEDMFMYLLVSEHAMSTVLLRDQGVQQLVYYISKTLVDAETRYLPLEKLVLALVHATRKLPQYFQAHTVFILTEYPLQSLLKRSDFTGRIAKWGTRLGSFDIRYKPWNVVKGQVLVDFVAEFSFKNNMDMVCHVENRSWRVFVDGASSALGASSGIVIITPEGIKMGHSFRLGFKASNNEAEYEALIAGLKTALDLGARDVEVYSDSLLVVNQVQGNFEARDSQMKEYLKVAKQIMAKFSTTSVTQVARGKNRYVDSLAMLASAMMEDIPQQIKVELIAESSISAMADWATKVDVAAITTAGSCWMDPIIEFLAEDRIPDDESEANKICRVASRYWLLVDRKLYRRSFGGPYLLCLPGKVDELLAKLHEGVCGSHVGGRLLAHRAMTQGFWWPKMRNDAAEYVRKCERCQKHAHLIH